jgi:CRISPR-associated protein Cmr1
MARPTPPAPPVQLVPREDHGMIVEKRSYELITPLFGGGVEPNTPDPVTTIRATEIRGHLRFWWRATRGGQFKTIEELKAKEDEIWGSTETPSAVSIEVSFSEKNSKGKELIVRNNYGEVISAGAPQSKYGYVAFPLFDALGKTLQEEISFQLKFVYPEYLKEDIELVLWAWESFGGIGARTRRGFGAIVCTNKDKLKTINEFLSYTRLKLQSLVRPNEIAFSLLSSNEKEYVFITEINENTKVLKQLALNVWQQLFTYLKDFRQYRNGRGRSYWPEADAIRNITGNMANYTDYQDKLHDHTRPTVALNGLPLEVFPRASFGLPLIYQFKDNKKGLRRDEKKYRENKKSWTPPRDPDPENISIKGKDFNRWSSPLILRPILCSDGIIGSVVRLLQPSIISDQLTLDGIGRDKPRIRFTSEEIKHLQRQNQNNQPNIFDYFDDEDPDVLDAFMNFVRSKNND